MRRRWCFSVALVAALATTFHLIRTCIQLALLQTPEIPRKPSLLFPRPLQLLRQGLASLDSAYGGCPQYHFSVVQAAKRQRPDDQDLLDAVNMLDRPCSCSSSNNKLCCERCVFWSHKMGAAMLKPLLQPFENIKLCDFEGNTGTWTAWDQEHLFSPNTDYRDVIVLRNIYDTLVSGYLYHLSGRECWTDWYGRAEKGVVSPFTKDWQRFLTSHINDSSHEEAPTICHYLANHTHEEGMRAYIDWVFHAYYEGTFTQWALVHGLQCPHVQERTRMVCFENLEGTSPSATNTLNDMLHFLSNGNLSYHSQQQGDKEAQGADRSGHATSKDVTLRKQIRQVIDHVDKLYYNGDIAWLDSILPC